jgi:hypothetical protein
MVILNIPHSYNKEHREKTVKSFAGWKNTGLPLSSAILSLNWMDIKSRIKIF